MPKYALRKRGNGGQRFAKKAPRPGEPSLQTVAHRYGSHAVYCARCRALQRHIASTRRRAIGMGIARAHSSYAQAAPCELRRQARTCYVNGANDTDMMENILTARGANGGSTLNSPTPWHRLGLSAYAACHWYGHRARTVRSVEIIKHGLVA